MNVSLPKPSEQYSYDNEVEARRLIEAALGEVQSTFENIVLQPDQIIIMTSPDGTQYYLTVADDGTLSTTAL